MQSLQPQGRHAPKVGIALDSLRTLILEDGPHGSGANTPDLSEVGDATQWSISN